MLFKSKKIKKRMSLMMVLVITLMNMVIPVGFHPTVYADAIGLAITQVMTATTVGPEQEIESTLNYSTVSEISHFYNVQIIYDLPIGAVFTGVIESGHVTTVSCVDINNVTATGANIRKIVFNMKNKEDAGPDNQFKAGSSGSVKVKFKFPAPSVYPNGASITLNAATITGNKGSDTGTVDTGYSSQGSLTYVLSKSWEIDKTGPTELIISNDPTQTEIDATYTIKLKNGNINLKDVTITDTLPQNATFVSSTLLGQPGVSEDLLTPGKVIWHIEDIAATEKSFDVTIKYAVARGANPGVIVDDICTNQVSVEGYPVQIQSDGSFQKVTDNSADPFAVKTDEAATTFKASTAKWGVHTTGPTLVILTQNPTVNIVDVNYTVTLSGGDVSIINGEMVYTIPDDVQSVEMADGGSVNLVAHTIIWSGINLAANGSLTKNVTLRYPIDRVSSGVGVWDSDQRKNTVTASSYFDPDTDEIETTFIISQDKWSLSKIASNTISVKHQETDGEPGGNYVNITYGINLSGSQYTMPLKNIVIVDTLPEHATYISNTSGQEPVSGTNASGKKTLTWNFTDAVYNSKPNFNVIIQYAIDRDGTGPNAGYIPGNFFDNSAAVTANEIDGAGNIAGVYIFAAGKGAVTKRVTVVTAAYPQPAVSVNIQKVLPNVGTYNKDSTKLIEYKNFDRGDDITYVMDFNNNTHNNEVLLEAKLLEDSLPDIIDYKILELGKSAAAVSYDFYYTTDGTNWIYEGAHNTSANETVNLQTLLGGQSLKGFKYQFTQDIPKSFTLSEKIKLTGTLQNSAGDARYDANLKLSYKYRIFEGISGFEEKLDKVGFDLLWDMAWISEMNKTMVTAYSSGSGHVSNKEVEYQLKVTNHAGLGTKDLVNPVLVDVLPAGFEYLGNVTFNSSMGVIGLGTPSEQVLNNYPNLGETTIRWSWPANSSLKIGETLTLKYKTKVKSYAGVGTHYNKFYLYASEAFKWSSPMTWVSDNDNLSGGVSSNLLKAQELGTNILETAAIESVLWVKGELDSSYSQIPSVGKTVAGGIADYLLEVQNASNIYVKELEVVDILPFVGDTNVANTNARDSAWRPYMIAAIPKGMVDGVVTDANGNKSRANLEVYYSTAQDPIRNSQTGSSIGTQNPNWSPTPPADISTVQSLKFVINTYEEDGKGNGEMLLKPGSKIQIAWKMRAPMGTQPNKTAWNSIGQMATVVEANGTIRTLMSAVPLKVGIQVESSTKGEIGDFVWLDANKDGVQSALETGINGIPVHLYEQIAGSWQMTKTTLTGNNQDGKPGYYLFPHLDVGNYYVSFDAQGLGYEITKTQEGSNRTVDSNGYEDAGMIRTPMIALGTGVNDYGIDLGLFAANLAIKKTGDRTIFNYAGDTIHYTIKVTNNGPINITNVWVKDSLIGLSTTIATLTVGESKTFNGSYITKTSDVLNKNVVNTATTDSDQTAEISVTWTAVYQAPPIPSGGGGGGGGTEPPKKEEPIPPVEPKIPDIPAKPLEPKPPVIEKTTPEKTPVEGKVEIPEGKKPEIGKLPKNGEVTLSETGKWIYTPDPGFTGKDNFTIKIIRPDGTEEEILIEIDVEEIPLGVVPVNETETGISSETEKLPQTGEESPFKMYLTGLSLIILGWTIKRKNTKSSKV